MLDTFKKPTTPLLAQEISAPIVDPLGFDSGEDVSI